MTASGRNREQPPSSPFGLGATYQPPSSTHFRVWAPHAHTISVRIIGSPERRYPLERKECGYWEATIQNVTSGSLYRYIIDEQHEHPDPVSRFQPLGVHGPSQVVDSQAFPWTDHQWKGLPLEDYIVYELHTGTFTPEGTFDAIIPKLPYLRDQVGITAVELMPVAQFPGRRNWGYDGTYLYAPQNSYGGPDGLKRLVDACHAHEMAVIMDVVYNHLGPEGNYLGAYGPYFTDVYKTPWGNAVNYDGPHSDAVREYVVNNAVYWIQEFHCDALRLDAIHGIFDFSAKHILQDIGEAVHAIGKSSGRYVWVIPESDLNDVRIISPVSKGGYGLDAQWSDDFHHSLHCLLTGEQNGYYEDFGKLADLATAYKQAFVYDGRFSPHRKRRHGNSPKGCPPSQFVVCAQNHDQVGNRAMGDRHSILIPFDGLKVSKATVLLAPYIPMLFMGEEYGETSPFLYFIDHGDPDLIEAVRNGRKREFAAFGWTNVADPYDPATYEQSRLRPQFDTDQRQDAQLRWCQALIRLRKTIPALGTASKRDQLAIWAFPKLPALCVHRKAKAGPDAFLLLGFNQKAGTVRLTKPQGRWLRQLDSLDKAFGGQGESGSPRVLTIGGSEHISLNLPPYAAWIYTKQEEA